MFLKNYYFLPYTKLSTVILIVLSKLTILVLIKQFVFSLGFFSMNIASINEGILFFEYKMFKP